MEFEDNTNNNDQEQEDEINLHEEEEEDDEDIYDSPPPSRGVLKPSTEIPHDTTTGGGGGFMVVHGGSSGGGGGGNMFRFRECLKNQAVNIGGHTVDGCGEFMPSGHEGTIDALKCAACGCHRNFHRKELPYFHAPPPQQQQQPPPQQGFFRLPAPVSYRPPQAQPPSRASPLQLALPPPTQRDRSEEDRMETSSAEAGGGGGGSSRKRYRTKFTAEQKEGMLGLAERIGWRIQRQDDELIQRFCQESGVPRQVLKVWLHNNKHTLGKSSSSSSSPLHIHQNPCPPPPPTQSSFHREQDQP